MKAMILAAGIGERMRPLTDSTPKPLLRVANVPLIEHHIRRLAAAGFTELVINVAHLGQQIVDYCGDGSRWQVAIVFSRESKPLETAGGIHQALPLLGDAPFLVVNGDVWIDYPFERLRTLSLHPAEDAHLVMVDNRPQHPKGDFTLTSRGWIRPLKVGASGLTYAGLAVFSPAFFADMSPGKLPLRPLLDAAIARSALGGEHYTGHWEDVGTPQRLQALDALLQTSGGTKALH